MKRLIQYTDHSCERVSLFYIYSVLSYSFRISIQHCFQPVGLQPGGAVLKHEGKFIQFNGKTFPQPDCKHCRKHMQLFGQGCKQ